MVDVIFLEEVSDYMCGCVTIIIIVVDECLNRLFTGYFYPRVSTGTPVASK